MKKNDCITETINKFDLAQMWSSDMTVYQKTTFKQFLNRNGVKRLRERKKNMRWVVDLAILDRKKWLMAKIKYGI